MEDITDKMYEIIDFLKRKNYKSIYIFNSDNEKYTSNDFQFAIVIGGAMLSRGIRFKNLITELIMSKTKKLALDTLLQKAR
ncbi:hypothetical protein FACS1894166_02660 [Bacilli bacterium]|nr:hypothetical protein FACS1894166_02660 [Bacilli bacterium]